MDPRLYLAGQALAGMLDDPECNPSHDGAAKEAVGYADAILRLLTPPRLATDANGVLTPTADLRLPAQTLAKPGLTSLCSDTGVVEHYCVSGFVPGRFEDCQRCQEEAKRLETPPPAPRTEAPEVARAAEQALMDAADEFGRGMAEPVPHEWRAGDLARCITPDIGNILRVGDTHAVASVDADGAGTILYFTAFGDGFFDWRFTYAGRADAPEPPEVARAAEQALMDAADEFGRGMAEPVPHEWRAGDLAKCRDDSKLNGPGIFAGRTYEVQEVWRGGSGTLWLALKGVESCWNAARFAFAGRADSPPRSAVVADMAADVGGEG